MRTLALAAVVVLWLPRPAAAQTPQYAQAMRAAAALELAARTVADPARPAVSADVLAPTRRRSDRATGTTLMIIGGGAVVIGAVVGGGGGAVLIVGGVGVGGYGFYLYQR